MSDEILPASDPPCHRVEFHGRVQGVGFRLTATQIARRFLVSGYVKNLAGGTVVMVVRADRQVLEKFLDEMDAAFPGYIESREIREATPNECFDVETRGGFQIRY